MASNRPSAFGIADVVIVATKSNELEEVISELRPCIGPQSLDFASAQWRGQPGTHPGRLPILPDPT